MLLGNKSEKPVYSPLNGATFVRKCICRLSSVWVVPMKKIAKSSLISYFAIESVLFLHTNKHTGSKELMHHIFTACIRKDRLSSSCHYVSKVEVCQILEHPFQRCGGMILGIGDAAKRKQDEINVSVHKAAE